MKLQLNPEPPAVRVTTLPHTYATVPSRALLSDSRVRRPIACRDGAITSLMQTSGSPTIGDRFGGRMTRFRWVILGLVFLGTTLNYLDRLVMGILAPGPAAAVSHQQRPVRLHPVGLRPVLRLRSARRRAASWTGSARASGTPWRWRLERLVHAPRVRPRSARLRHVRGLLGVSESPAFPAATKTLAEWFPRRERAFAFGFVNAGTNMGAILAPAVVPWLAANYGWQWAFIGTGLIGFLWLALWIPLYRRRTSTRACRRPNWRYINSDPPEPIDAGAVGRACCTYRQAWAFAIGKFLTDSMWWFYMTWLPKFLHDRHGLDLMHIGLPLVIIYVMADIGSIAGGWLSSSMIKQGVSVNRARKTAHAASAPWACCRSCSPSRSSGIWTAVLILGLATASHQGFSTNLYTLVSDMFPKRAVAPSRDWAAPAATSAPRSSRSWSAISWLARRTIVPFCARASPTWSLSASFICLLRDLPRPSSATDDDGQVAPAFSPTAGAGIGSFHARGHRTSYQSITEPSSVSNCGLYGSRFSDLRMSLLSSIVMPSPGSVGSGRCPFTMGGSGFASRSVYSLSPRS